MGGGRSTGGGLSGTGGGLSGSGGGRAGGSAGGLSGVGGGLAGGTVGVGGGLAGGSVGGGLTGGSGGGIAGGTTGGDTTAPTVTSVTFTPASVSTQSAAAIVTITTRITDAASGLSHASVTFTSPTRAQTRSASIGSSERIMGNANDGTYSDTITFPQYSEPGTWTLSMSLYDAVGNYRSISGPQLQALGITTTISVTGTGDVEAPAIASFTSTPPSITTQTGAAMVSINTRLTDALSGLSHASVTFTSPTRAQTRSASVGSSERVTGTATDGTYTDTITFPQFSEPGPWTLSLSLYDAVGNYRSMSAAQLQALGIATTLTVTGSGDTVAPTLASVSFTPSTLSTVSAAATVVLDARITDTGSGLSHASVTFTSPSRAQTRSASVGSAERVSGSAVDGTYADTITFPQFSEPGTWNLSVSLYDAVGNYRSLSASQLQAMGFATTVTLSP